MARANEIDGVLRACPVCATPVKDTEQLGLRLFDWANEALPGSVGLMDFDGVLHHAKSGRFLVVEMKPPGAWVSRGARLTYKELVKLGVFDVWVVWGPDKEGNVQRGVFDRAGRIQHVVEMSLDDLSEDIAAWWACREENCA